MKESNEFKLIVKHVEETIPDNQKLFYRIHEVNIDNSVTDEIEKIKPSAFNPQPVSQGSTQMSVNWEKYSTAESTKLAARKNPDKNGVVSFNSTKIRTTPINLNVTHNPSQNSRAHSLIHEVVSEKNDPEIRLLIRESCKWEIKINPIT